MIKQGCVYWAIRSGSKADCDICIRMGMRFSFGVTLKKKTCFLQGYGENIKSNSPWVLFFVCLFVFCFFFALSCCSLGRKFSQRKAHPGEAAHGSLFRRIKCSPIVKLPSRYFSKPYVRSSSFWSSQNKLAGCTPERFSDAIWKRQQLEEGWLCQRSAPWVDF